MRSAERGAKNKQCESVASEERKKRKEPAEGDAISKEVSASRISSVLCSSSRVHSFPILISAVLAEPGKARGR